MNDAEPIPDPILFLQPAETVCVTCKAPIVGEKFWIPKYACNQRDSDPYHPACSVCYAAYVKTKFGSGNTNPDDIQII